MHKWTARIHKTGSKIQVLDNGKIIKEVQASEDTFSPAEAKDFANELIVALQRKSKQMTDTEKTPAVDTKAEEHVESTKAAEEDAKGKDAEGKISSLKQSNSALIR